MSAYHCLKCVPVKLFACPNHLAEHVRVYHKGSPFKCRFCHKTFRYRLYLSAHERKHRERSATNCHEINQIKMGELPQNELEDEPLDLSSSGPFGSKGVAPSSSRLGLRKEAASRSKKRFNRKWIRLGNRYCCSRCATSFAQINYLMDHERVKHDGILFCCSCCDKKFKFRSQLCDHMKMHRPSKTISRSGKQMVFDKTCVVDGKLFFVCKQCDKQFRNIFNLRYHVRRNCSSVKRANKALASSTPENAQQDDIKTDPPQRVMGWFKCNFCNKAFGSRARCEMHQKRHGESKREREISHGKV